MSTDPNHPIVLACDNAYAMPLATALRSIVDSNANGWPLEFHVLTDAISANNRAKILDSLPAGSATIRWVEVDLSSFNDFSTIGHISKVTYARFLIPREFPDTITKVLYLDCDIIVLDDLQLLWEADLQGGVLGAVLDGLDSQIKSSKPSLVPRVRDYFNAGVLLIDLKRWRELRISEKAIEYLMAHPESPFSDQDALNVACDGLWTRLDSRWNFVDYYERTNVSKLSAEKRPGIVHFAAWNKPWNAGTLNVNAKLYNSFRHRTEFARSNLEKFRDAMLFARFCVKSALKKCGSLLRFPGG